MVIYITLRPLL